jgi:hypothetical protein
MGLGTGMDAVLTKISKAGCCVVSGTPSNVIGVLLLNDHQLKQSVN